MKEASTTINNLVIVESPAKAKTIERFLGKEFQVVSCFGHIRDLVKKNFGIDKEKNYAPKYEVSAEKKKVVSELRKLAKITGTVWLASDEDREGEAIAWHLSEVLKLKPENTRRIVFDEITKDAILFAVKNPRSIDQNLVNAQQARRILDRLVGFELSPILWRKVKPSLSAGRVQSVAVRILVEREREIMDFEATSSYKVSAVFTVIDGDKSIRLKAELANRFKTKQEAVEFLRKCIGAEFKVTDIVTKPSKKSPAPPFTTSTLQQEASRKMGFSVAQTMRVAQKLYEAGKITYMRTDSVHLSDLALNSAREEITRLYGAKYAKTRRFKTKSKGAQEAHEAIRPTYMNKQEASGSQQEKRLYDLIWKRTIASQMSEAQLEKTTVTIDVSTTKERFVARGEVIKFEGFLKVYLESTDTEEEGDETAKGLLPPVHVNDRLAPMSIEAVERFSQRPARYTEASLVKKLEELGIGRPSTYAPTISTIQQRGYVVKEEREGTPRNFHFLSLAGDNIKEEVRTETTGAEKNKLYPTDIGMVVNDFLVKHFEEILAYNFTAFVEKEFDEIAEGKLIWYKMIDDFYKPFHQKVEHTIEHSERNSGERILGTDPATGKPVSVRIGRYGPMAQLGESNPDEDPAVEKPRFARLQPHQRLETINLEEALVLFRLPRTLGQFEDSDVTVAIGRFGPYALHKSKFYSLKKGIDDPYTIKLDRATQLIEEKREADKNKVIQIFEGEEPVQVLNGRWGPYISYQKKNYKIPKTTDPKSLTLKDCMVIIEKGPSKSRGARGKKKK
ncbi:MAG: type I DNA topoisomerase [bacterium]|nr:type I DNA topoisomerase [bacterium]